MTHIYADSLAISKADYLKKGKQAKILAYNNNDNNNNNNNNYFLALRPNAGQGLLILEVFRSHSLDAPQSVGLLWTSDQPVAETST